MEPQKRPPNQLDKDAKDLQRELEEWSEDAMDYEGFDAVEMGLCGHDE